jgi:hypothetical protein
MTLHWLQQARRSDLEETAMNLWQCHEELA